MFQSDEQKLKRCNLTKTKIFWFTVGFTAGVIISYRGYKYPTYIPVPNSGTWVVPAP